MSTRNRVPRTELRVARGIGVLIAFLMPLAALAATGTIDSTNKYAWGENIGWVNFATGQSTVTITDTALTGYAWGENVGWVSFNCSTTGSCATVSYKVSSDYDPAPPPGGGGPPPPPAGTPTPTPTPTLTSTPSPSPTASPSLTPTPSPSLTPETTPTETPIPIPPPVGGPPAPPPPGGIEPPGPPPSAAPPPVPGIIPEPIIEVVTEAAATVGEVLDELAERVVAEVAETCGTMTGAPSCVTTVVALAPVAAAAAAAAAPAQTQATAQWFFHAIGLKRRPRTWGVVYDAATKRPVLGARVEFLDPLGRVLETQFSDRDGHYGFLAKPSSIGAQELRGSIRARKDGYRFPSSAGIVGTDYVVYDNVYRGGEVRVPVSSGEIVRFNIPLDPVPAAARPAGFLGVLGKGLGERLLELGFFVGLITVPVHYFLVPSTRNLVVMVAFFGANLLRFSVLYRPYGLVRDATTGKRLAFALVTLEDPSGKRVGFTVSDEFGRFILKGERGQRYRLTAYTPANILPQRSTSQDIATGTRFSRSAWVTAKIKV